MARCCNARCAKCAPVSRRKALEGLGVFAFLLIGWGANEQASTDGGAPPHAPATAAKSAPDPAPARPLTELSNLTTTDTRGCAPGPDIASGNLDRRVQGVLRALASRYQIRVSCARTGHSTYVKGTNRVSNHHVWRAVDIDQVNGEPVSPESPLAREVIGFLDRLEGDLRPTEIGSPFAVGREPFFTDSGHQGHIHIGYSN